MNRPEFGLELWKNWDILCIYTFYISTSKNNNAEFLQTFSMKTLRHTKVINISQ